MSNFSSYNIFLLVLILIQLSNISAIYPNNYTYPLLYKVRIGSQSTEIKLLLNSFSANNLLFTNTNRNYYKQISEGRKSDAFMDKLEFNGQIIRDFPFTLLMDNTGLNSQEIQGEFGLGIDKDNKNDLVENLLFNQIITKRKLILEVSNDLKSININLDTELYSNEFKYCNLSSKDNLDLTYNEAWICDLSHIINIEDDTMKSNSESLLENADEVKAKAVFDTRQKNLIFPSNYLAKFKNFIELNKCKIITDKSLDEKYIQCDKDNVISKKKSIYFLIDGYGLSFKVEELFEDDGKYINSIIKFSDSLNKYNLFIFGIPLFKKYNNLFDYDNKSIGFKGDGIYDLTNAYNIWLQKNNIVKGAKEVINNKTENNGNVNYKEQIAKIFGIIIGVSIIVCVLYHQYRRRNGKLHSKLIEEKNGNQMNNQIINDA